MPFPFFQNDFFNAPLTYSQMSLRFQVKDFWFFMFASYIFVSETSVKTSVRYKLIYKLQYVFRVHCPSTHSFFHSLTRQVFIQCLHYCSWHIVLSIEDTKWDELPFMSNKIVMIALNLIFSKINETVIFILKIFICNDFLYFFLLLIWNYCCIYLLLTCLQYTLSWVTYGLNVTSCQKKIGKCI